MNNSEMISVVWICFFSLFAIVVFFLADRDKNKQWIEAMGAFLFTAIALSTLIGGAAPQYFTFMFGTWWDDDSYINSTVMIAGMIISWCLLAWGMRWLIGLVAASVVVSVLGWTGLLFSDWI